MNMKEIIWFSSKEKCFFLIPNGSEITLGNYEIVNLFENSKNVNLENIQQYQCTQQQALAHLQNNLKESLHQTKKSWQNLQKFSQLTNTPIDLEEVQKNLKKIFSETTIETQIPKEQITQLMNDLFSGDELEGISQTATNLVKEVFGDISKDIPENPDDLESWANQLHHKFFAKEEAQKQKKITEDIRKSVRDSIAQRLRENGLEPID